MKNVVLVSVAAYRSLRAARPISAGTRLFGLTGKVVKSPSTYSVQIDIDRHVLPHRPGVVGGRISWQFMNHSCEPNVAVDVRNRAFVAAREIAAGEELAFNYNTTEWAMADPFQCDCLSPQCAGRIQGFSYLASAEKEALLPYCADHIRVLAGVPRGTICVSLSPSYSSTSTHHTLRTSSGVST